MGTANKKYNRQIKQCRCPLFGCGAELVIANHGKDWWVMCSMDSLHIPQYLVHHAEEAVAFALKYYKQKET